MFEPLPTEFSFPKAEERVLDIWSARGGYQFQRHYAQVTTEDVHESFLNVVWWNGTDIDQHAAYALLRLTASVDDPDALLAGNLATQRIR